MTDEVPKLRSFYGGCGGIAGCLSFNHEPDMESPRLKDVQEYGEYLGVEVYVEIDLPRHTASISQAYPDLIIVFNQQPWSPYAQELPSGQLKLNHPQSQNRKHSTHRHLPTLQLLFLSLAYRWRQT